MDKLSYAFGMNIAESLEHLREDVDVDVLMRGLQDVLAGREPLMTFTEAGEVINEYSTMRRQAGERERQELAGKNYEEGLAFLAENATKEGVVTTASGLQYIVLQEGDGPKPTRSNRVKVHYTGTLLDGTVFDSSVERGEPTVFELGRVIEGWIEGLQLMSVGSKYKFFIPSEMAYGEAGPRQIGPNATLIFEVELLEIVD